MYTLGDKVRLRTFGTLQWAEDSMVAVTDSTTVTHLLRPHRSAAAEAQVMSGRVGVLYPTVCWLQAAAAVQQATAVRTAAMLVDWSVQMVDRRRGLLTREAQVVRSQPAAQVVEA